MHCFTICFIIGQIFDKEIVYSQLTFKESWLHAFKVLSKEKSVRVDVFICLNNNKLNLSDILNRKAVFSQWSLTLPPENLQFSDVFRG